MPKQNNKEKIDWSKMKLDPKLTRKHYNIVSKHLKTDVSVSSVERIAVTKYFANISLYLYELIYKGHLRKKYLVLKNNKFSRQQLSPKDLLNFTGNSKWKNFYAKLLKEVHGVDDLEIERYRQWLQPVELSSEARAILYRDYKSKFRPEHLRGAGKSSKNILH